MRIIRFTHALWHQRELFLRLSQRGVQGRYRGSILGWTWSLITPVLTLGVFTFVFTQVFQSRWDNLQQTGPLIFAINLFAGQIVFSIFSESANKAPGLIIENSNLVKKVVFPLEVLPAVSLAVALFHAAASTLILIIFQMLNGLAAGSAAGVKLTVLWLPIVWIPLTLGCQALCWLLSALGVYLRDLGQVVGVVTNLLMFLSAVFYPINSLPSRWRPLLEINPLVHAVEQTRAVVIAGKMPSMLYLVLGTAIGVIACELSFRAFKKSSQGFADVL